ncbi:DNA-binding transcriptional LysR family regulator [Rhizomicrobium palustre]|uniref:DNA-binding transcriptional LysR family regulator n=1 Tax=Rhizomicrobium palustre TaxID=189966 RepID=A0A846N1T3_9PROT|nr:LysR family transcriptional regulator [Rhizomicrobium palustre]NIK89908.1 DNA-binding transcriptional LysR family regulator [Rhizomicrobium palustre]
MSEISWDYYRSFLAVLCEGSLSGAAKALGVAQPTIGRHMDALEKALGLTLFTRSRNGFKPTEVALAVKSRAEAMASMAEALRRDASGHGKEMAGSVRISASEVMGVEALPSILTSLGETHPGLGFELVLSDALSDLLSRSADIAVRMADPVQDSLIAQRAGSIQLGFFAHKRYLKGRSKPRKIGDLADHRVIGFDTETGYIRDMLRRYPALMGLRYDFRTNSFLAQLAAIRAGAGIGLCQIPLAARDANLVPLLPNALSLSMPCYVVMHEDLRSTPRYRMVFQALVAGLKRFASGVA